MRVIIFFPIGETSGKNFEAWLSAILNRHFYLLNAIFLKASMIFFRLSIFCHDKIHAGLNITYLRISRTLLNNLDHTILLILKSATGNFACHVVS